MKQLIWISYDLGINGDYEQLYYWLDSCKAVECGDSVAAFHYEYEKDLVLELKKEIKSSVKLRNKDRIYLIYKDSEGKLKGKFLFGKRKSTPWEGYSAGVSEDVEDV